MKSEVTISGNTKQFDKGELFGAAVKNFMKDGEDMAEQHQAQDQHEQTAEELHELKRIRREKLAELQAAGKDPFQQVRFERDHYTTDIHEHFDELEGKTVRLAGRMMSKRIMGKASFSDMRDRYGRLQLYIKRDNVGEDVYKGYKKFDIGDIIGIEGEVFRTQKGEISVSVTELTLLSKNLAPLPEKWHGLKDTDMRYRQRYVDLIVNPEVRDTFEKRSAIVREIRNFMDSRGFMEVETPCLNTIPGGAVEGLGLVAVGNGGRSLNIVGSIVALVQSEQGVVRAVLLVSVQSVSGQNRSKHRASRTTHSRKEKAYKDDRKNFGTAPI